MQSGNIPKLKKTGFTLVELLVVLSILALLLTLAVPRYFKNVERAKEATLRQDLNTIRDGIDKFYADNGKYPSSLEELVERQYINKLPIDPITESTSTWVIIPPDSNGEEDAVEGDVYDVQSGATGKAEDGTKFSDW
jgi:general secretion pathway protein G